MNRQAGTGNSRDNGGFLIRPLEETRPLMLYLSSRCYVTTRLFVKPLQPATPNPRPCDQRITWTVVVSSSWATASSFPSPHNFLRSSHQLLLYEARANIEINRSPFVFRNTTSTCPTPMASEKIRGRSEERLNRNGRTSRTRPSFL